MKKKKWIIIVVAVIIVFAIIGDSGSNDEKDSKQAENSVTKVENTTPRTLQVKIQPITKLKATPLRYLKKGKRPRKTALKSP